MPPLPATGPPDALLFIELIEHTELLREPNELEQPCELLLVLMLHPLLLLPLLLPLLPGVWLGESGYK